MARLADGTDAARRAAKGPARALRAAHARTTRTPPGPVSRHRHRCGRRQHARRQRRRPRQRLLQPQRRRGRAVHRRDQLHLQRGERQQHDDGQQPGRRPVRPVGRRLLQRQRQKLHQQPDRAGRRRCHRSLQLLARLHRISVGVRNVQPRRQLLARQRRDHRHLHHVRLSGRHIPAGGQRRYAAGRRFQPPNRPVCQQLPVHESRTLGLRHARPVGNLRREHLLRIDDLRRPLPLRDGQRNQPRLLDPQRVRVGFQRHPLPHAQRRPRPRHVRTSRPRRAAPSRSTAGLPATYSISTPKGSTSVPSPAR